MYIQSLQPTFIATSSTLSVIANKSGNLIVKVLDLQGKIAKTVKTKIDEGSQQLDINLSDLTSGMYVLNAFNGDVFLRSIRFVKQ
jgi:hypothetical protein